MTAETTRRLLLRIDALMELAIAAPLLAGRPRGVAGALPVPAAVAGGVLVPFAALLWASSGPAPRRGVQALAAVNAATAAIFGAAGSKASTPFSAADRAFATATVAGLSVLATAQAASSARDD